MKWLTENEIKEHRIKKDKSVHKYAEPCIEVFPEYDWEESYIDKGHLHTFFVRCLVGNKGSKKIIVCKHYDVELKFLNDGRILHTEGVRGSHTNSGEEDFSHHKVLVDFKKGVIRRLCDDFHQYTEKAEKTLTLLQDMTGKTPDKT